ncbi:nuclease-related domain-containing protein [Deinococcus aestuarii]|uniref:nuclease-related domain-containing protein n=1 Tax=Deinococcus aestuarii TaxID=2774531 RepID=UPI001C0CA6BD|nr:nuclease-related domain-containing protein [Deinococcus aestuarii]
MIAKEHEPFPTTDRLQKAGDEAEKQMAHYLRRAFGDDPDVHIFNGLRFEHGGEVAQIDHLVFHRAGMIIVESKSVTSAVRINEREEWARRWDGRWRGMASPVLQARRQADLLRSLLQAHREQLRNKVLFGLKQGGFRAFMINVVVAISDRGVVEHQGKLPDVKKADQVPDRVRELIADHTQLAHPFSRDKRAEQWGFNLSPEEVVRVGAFLRTQHQGRPPNPDPSCPPVASAPSQGVGWASPVSPPSARFAAQNSRCGKCEATDLEIRFGHSYYFKCRSCGANTVLKLTCTTCGGPQRTRKSGTEFYAECSTCRTSELYFTNP